MPLPTGEVLGILADNMRLRRSASCRSRPATRTAGPDDLDLPRGGDTVLYTGHALPAHPVHRGAWSRSIERVGEHAAWRAWPGSARRVNRVVDLTPSARHATAGAGSAAAYEQGPDRHRRGCCRRVGRRRSATLYRGRPVLPGRSPTTSALDDARRRRTPGGSHAASAAATACANGHHRSTRTRRTCSAACTRSWWTGSDLEVRSYLEVLAERQPDGRHDRCPARSPSTTRACTRAPSTSSPSPGTCWYAPG